MARSSDHRLEAHSRKSYRPASRLAAFLGSVIFGSLAVTAGADIAASAVSSAGFAPLLVFMAGSLGIALTAGLSWDCLLGE